MAESSTSDNVRIAVVVAGGGVALYLLWPLLKAAGGAASLLSDVESKAKTAIDATWHYAVVKPWSIAGSTAKHLNCWLNPWGSC